MAESKLDRLLSNLQTSGLQQKDQPLFQVISQLIKYLQSAQSELTEISGIVNNPTSGLPNLTYLTDTDEAATLPNSRQLLAGDRITFDDTVANKRTLDVPIDEVILTGADESGTLPNSRRLLAGDNVSFDDTIVNERTIDVSLANIRDVGYWTPLVNVVGLGDVEMVVTDGGQPIAVWTPT